MNVEKPQRLWKKDPEITIADMIHKDEINVLLNGNPAKAGRSWHNLRRLDTERFQEDGWQEPCESRGSRTVLRGTGGETPPVYPTHQIFKPLINTVFSIYKDIEKGRAK